MLFLFITLVITAFCLIAIIAAMCSDAFGEGLSGRPTPRRRAVQFESAFVGFASLASLLLIPVFLSVGTVALAHTYRVSVVWSLGDHVTLGVYTLFSIAVSCYVAYHSARRLRKTRTRSAARRRTAEDPCVWTTPHSGSPSA